MAVGIWLHDEEEGHGWGSSLAMEKSVSYAEPDFRWIASRAVQEPGDEHDHGARGLTEELIGRLGYLGIALVLVLGGLGLPIPEEAPIVVAAILSRTGRMWFPLALGSCLAGVILGDLVVYFLGYFHGEKVLSLRLTRRFLTRQREAQIKGYFHRHGFKILVSGRFMPGFRTAAYLTAGILRLPMLKLILTDVVAASLSTTVFFGLGYLFAHQIQSGIQRMQHWAVIAAACGVTAWLVYRYVQARRRAGRPVGPPVLDGDEDPLSGAITPKSQEGPSPEAQSPSPAAGPANGPVDATDGAVGTTRSSPVRIE